MSKNPVDVVQTSIWLFRAELPDEQEPWWGIVSAPNEAAALARADRLLGRYLEIEGFDYEDLSFQLWAHDGFFTIAQGYL